MEMDGILNVATFHNYLNKTTPKKPIPGCPSLFCLLVYLFLCYCCVCVCVCVCVYFVCFVFFQANILTTELKNYIFLIRKPLFVYLVYL